MIDALGEAAIDPLMVGQKGKEILKFQRVSTPKEENRQSVTLHLPGAPRNPEAAQRALRMRSKNRVRAPANGCVIADRLDPINREGDVFLGYIP